MSIPLDPNRCAAMVDERLPEWIAEVNQMRREHYDKHYPNQYSNVFIDGGRKYLKLAYRCGSQTMVYCFVRAEDGAILKAASWKAPALNFKRGTIFDTKLAVRVHGTL